MFIVSIDKNNVKIAEKEMVTSGSVNAYECQFVFSDDWDEMTKTVTFKAGEKAISVTLDDEDKCVIPWEVLAVADVDLYVGVIGAAGAETEDPADDIVMPTIWGYMGTVRHGTTEGENTELPTPSAYERIMIEINAIKKDIDGINGTFDGGEVGQVWTKTENGEEWADGGAASAPSIGDNGNWYIGETDTGVKAEGTDGEDGISPTVTVADIEGGHKVTITDKNGEQVFDVMNGIGTDGDDGFSPTVVITEIENGYNLAVTDKNGTQSVNITNGADGFSPIVDITPIEGGHKVTITDASGPHSFIVTNGTGGEGGGGVSPIVDITPIEGGHRLTITDVTGSHSVDIMNGADGISPTITVADIEGGHSVTVTDKNGDQSFDVIDGKNGNDGISPTVSITDIEGGHNVTITDKNGDQSFDVMDGIGEDGISPTVSVTEIDNGHSVTITDKNGDQAFDVMNGNDGISPTVAVTTIEGGNKVTITDKNGDQAFDVMNGIGTDGISPTVAVADIDNGHKVTITDKNGEQSFNVIDGKNGNDGISPTVDITTIEGGNKVTITDASGQHSADIMNGDDGFSPIVNVTAIDNGHKVTITDKNGDQAFDVMNGVGADGKAATIKIGTVMEGDTPAVTNSGTATDAVFDFVLPGASGGAEYSMLKASTVSSVLNEYEYSMTKSVDGGIPTATGDKITIPKHGVHINGKAYGTYRDTMLSSAGYTNSGSVQATNYHVNSYELYDYDEGYVHALDFYLYNNEVDPTTVKFTGCSDLKYFAFRLSSGAYNQKFWGYQMKKLCYLYPRSGSGTIAIKDRNEKVYTTDKLLMISYMTNDTHSREVIRFEPFLFNGDTKVTLGDGYYAIVQLS